MPYNPRQREVERQILPLAADLIIGTLLLRPFSERGLLHTLPPAWSLAPLRSFGIKNWPQALLEGGLSDPCCHVSIPATSRTARMTANPHAGDPPWLGPEELDYFAC